MFYQEQNNALEGCCNAVKKRMMIVHPTKAKLIRKI